MKAIILSAGMGTRLLPLTYDMPKALIEIADAPLLIHTLFTLDRVGVSDITIVIGYYADKIREEIASYTSTTLSNLKITYIENSLYQTTGDAFSLWLAKNELKNDVIIIDGDLLFTEEMIQRLKDMPEGVYLAIDKKRVSEKETGVKMASSSSNKIIDIIRCAIAQGVDGRYIGIVRVSGDSLSIFKDQLNVLMKSSSKSTVYSQAILMMIEEGYEVYGIDMSDLPWTEIDTLEDLEYARRIFGGYEYDRNMGQGGK